MFGIDIQTEYLPFKEPFRITNYVFTGSDVVVAKLSDGANSGYGEASGVYYHDETVQSMRQQLASVADAVKNRPDRERLRKLLPPGGARNALDCALWDLEAKRAGKPVWELAGLSRPTPLVTTFTIGAGTPAEMACAAKALHKARALKLKLTAENPADCVAAVRAARPDVWLGVDANQGLSRTVLEHILPRFREAEVSLIEQPVQVGSDGELEGLNSPIPIAADESVQSVSDIKGLAGRYDVVNIKLDKCGGLTEGLAMAREARRYGLKVMVGCMNGSSLAMAPAFLLGQLCDFVDLDSPYFLSHDRDCPVEYADGKMFCPESLWGGAKS